MRYKIENHIFSDDHVKNGFEKAIGAVKGEDGYDKIYQTIMDADKKGLIKEGGNQLLITTKSGYTVGIRAFVRNGEMLNFDAFVVFKDSNISNYPNTFDFGNVNW